MNFADAVKRCWVPSRNEFISLAALGVIIAIVNTAGSSSRPGGINGFVEFAGAILGGALFVYLITIPIRFLMILFKKETPQPHAKK